MNRRYGPPHIDYAHEVSTDAVENFDELIETLHAAIKDQQQFNNPHEEGDEYYEDFWEGWYQGYLFWFVVEMSVPVGEAGKALKSTETMQSTVDRISTPQVQRAAQIAQQGGQTATAPVRYSRQQLSRPLAGTISLTDDAAHRLLDSSRSSGKQVTDAKTAGRLDDQTVRIVADGSGDRDQSFRRAVYRAADDDAVSYAQLDRSVRTIDEIDGSAKMHAERLVRGTDGAGIRVIDELDSSAVERLSRAYADELVDVGDIRRAADGLQAGHVDQAAVGTALTRASDIDADGHDTQRIRTADNVNSQYSPGYEDPYASGSLVVEYRTQMNDQFVRVHQADNQARSWMIQGEQIDGMNPSEIQQRFSLPEEPVYVSDVHVPADTNVRTGTVEANFGGERGAMQFELRDRISEGNFQNQRELPQ